MLPAALNSQISGTNTADSVNTQKDGGRKL